MDLKSLDLKSFNSRKESLEKKIMLWQSEICLMMAEHSQMQGHPLAQTYL